MTGVTAALVKRLRDETGAGMMDCKRALSESGGDIEAARDWLRAKGIAGAEKKADRAAAEGLVGIAVDGARAAMVEVNAETDFVARNTDFQDYVEKVARLALGADGDIERLAAAEMPGGGTVAEGRVEVAARVGENIVLRRTALVGAEKGVVGSYVHAAVRPGLGRIGALVALEGATGAEGDGELGKHLAMHVAAARPQAAAVEDLDPGLVARERAVLAEQAKESGKPEAIVEKMVEGRIRKFYAEAVLLEQVWVIDGETKVAKVLAAAGKGLRIGAFACFVLGEGVERGQTDFAKEVAGAIGG